MAGGLSAITVDVEEEIFGVSIAPGKVIGNAVDHTLFSFRLFVGFISFMMISADLHTTNSIGRFHWTDSNMNVIVHTQTFSDNVTGSNFH